MSNTSNALPSRARAFHSWRRSLLLIAGALLVILNLGSYGAGISWDLTKGNRYSINEGTIAIFQRLESPVLVRYSISRERPKYLANLERDVIARLTTFANAIGRQHFDFDPVRDVKVIDNTSAASGEMNARGISPHVVSGEGGAFQFYSTLEVTMIDAARPALIDLTTTASLEYDLVSAVVRMRTEKRRPAGIEATIKALTRTFDISYIYGGREGGPMPVERAVMAGEIANMLTGIANLSDKVRFRADNSPTSRLRGALKPTADLVQATDPNNQRGMAYSIFYYSGIVIDSGRGQPMVLSDIKEASDALIKAVVDQLWELDAKRPIVGVYEPRAPLRPELARAERFVQYGPPSLSTEQRIQALIERMGYDVLPETVTSVRGISPEIEALVLVRPGSLHPREVYELRTYLASGGRILLLHGTWHAPLMDRALDFNAEHNGDPSAFFLSGDAANQLAFARVEASLADTLRDYGVDTAPGILLGGESSHAFRVYGPAPKLRDLHYGDPIPYRAASPINPWAVRAEARPALSASVEALNLRGASTLSLNQARLSELGLEHEVILVTPPDSRLLAVPETQASVVIDYRQSGVDDLSAMLVPQLNGNWQAAAPEPAGGRPVALRLRGQFPFDPSLAPPPFAEERTTAPGELFRPSPGELIVVNAPDCAETIDFQGWKPGETALLGGSDQLADASMRSLLANALDSFIHGEELIDVRRSLVPEPRRLKAWTLAERQLWTIVNALLLPLIYAALVGWLLWRRYQRRVRHETRVGLR